MSFGARNKVTQSGTLTLTYEKNGKTYTLTAKVKDVEVHQAPIDSKYCRECNPQTVEELQDAGCQWHVPSRAYLEFEPVESTGRFARIEVTDGCHP